MSETVIKLESVTKKFGNFTAVNNIDIEVHAGETIGLVGPNGAGKTTTIKMIAKLLRPSSGTILVKNNSGQLRNLNHNPRNLVKRGFLIDVPSFYNMTANQLLRYFANLQNFPHSKINARIDELLELFKLSDWKHKKVKTFSKGMTQKMGIIQAIIHDPEIIILDEPQTGLDPNARIEIRQFIRNLQQMGKTIFVASHMLYEISEVCDKIALINHGNIIGFDTIENLETVLKTREIECEIEEPIPPTELAPIIQKLTNALEPYLDKEVDPTISKIPVKYFPNSKSFKIYYKSVPKVQSEVLKILVKEFEKDFSVISYTKPRSSQLERIYSQLITTDDASMNSNNKRRKK